MSRLSKFDLLHSSPPIGRGILQHFHKKTLLGILGYERLEADIGGVWLLLNKEVKRHRSYFFFLSMHKLFHKILTTWALIIQKKVEKSSQPLFPGA
jgi:hypothetical protein